MTEIKPIRTDDDHRAALAEIERLFDAKPGTAEADRLEVLSVLATAWESRHFPLDDTDPLDALTFAMKAQGRSQSDFAALLKSRSRASEVLNRRRPLSAEMIEAVSRAWSIPLAALGGLPRKTGGNMRRLALNGAAALALVAAVGATATGGLLWRACADLPDVERIEAIAAQPGYVQLSDMPLHIVKAFLAAEDTDFYRHGGTSVPGVVRAAAINLAAMGRGKKTVGATGIAEQVAKNLLLAGEAPSLMRRVKQAILAHRLEDTMSKDRILEIYLNELYLGDGCHGVAEAAQHYFGKPLDAITIGEAAVMAGLAKAPNAYRPNLVTALDQTRAKARRDWVLERMASDGLITVSAAHLAQTERLIEQ